MTTEPKYITVYAVENAPGHDPYILGAALATDPFWKSVYKKPLRITRDDARRLILARQWEQEFAQRAREVLYPEPPTYQPATSEK